MEYNKIIASQFCKLLIVRLYDDMIVTIWEIRPRIKKRNFNVKFRKKGATNSRVKNQYRVCGEGQLKNFEWKPIEPRSLVFHHETSGGIFLYFFFFLDDENILKKFPGL